MGIAGNMVFRANFVRRGFAAFILLVLAPLAAVAQDTALDLSSHTGKVVIVDFWASWCVPCRRSFPWLNQMHRKYEDDGLVIIGVNLDQEPGAAEKFLQEFPPDFRIHYEDSEKLAKQFEVEAMPTSYLIGRTGEIIKRHYGFLVKKQDEYEAAIVAALNETE